MPSRRPARIAAVALLWAAVAGCGDAGSLEGAGATPTAVGPARLWPSMTPASSPAWDYDEAETEIVKGVRVPGGDIREADPVAVVRAEIAAHPEDYSGAKAPYRETARVFRDCGGAGRSACPVLEPYYRDLTGDGREDMTLGFSLRPARMTAVRVYTVDHRRRLVRVMENDDAVSAVELAGRSVIVRAPSEVSGYEYRLQWTWDPDQRAMLLTHDEMLPTGGRRPSGRPRPSDTSPPGAETSPSGTSRPNASPSDSPPPDSPAPAVSAP
ncbi:hypothetical protein ABZ354_19155 [Streptomyces sp. NPDC005925]|uniref:hypothetical protein n=1 Tax=Streptomyces sp. NPDC005925 TaxID=3157172 RepID=UPI00340D0BDD